MFDNIFLQISAILAVAVVIAFGIRLLKQPLIVGYIIAGITVGPMFFNIMRGEHTMYEAFAQFGIVLLLFIIGLNLNFRHLKSIGKASFVTGIGQVVFTSVVGFLILMALKMPVMSAVYLAIAITFSSTIIIMKLLMDKKDTETVYGRHTIGLMLVQDIIAVLLMVGIGMFMNGHGAINSISLLVAKIALVMAFLLVATKYALPWFLNKICYSSELLFIFTISWCFGMASILYLLGFSIEIGAIVAGITLSSSPYQPEIASRIKPLRDFFLIMFFILLGSEMNMASISAIWLPGVVLSLFILIGNPLILYFLFRLLKFTRRNSFLAGLTAAQVSEFGFVILFTGRQIGHLNSEIVPIFTMVAILTIFASSYLIINSEKIYNFLLPFFNLFGPDKYRQINKIPPNFDVWLVGCHRVGAKVCEALKANKEKFCVIDFDPKVIAGLKRKKIHAIFGDIADVEFLENLHMGGANLIIMTIPSADDQLNLINHVRKINPSARIIANAYQIEDADALYSAGVDYTMMPHAIGGDWIGEIIRRKKLSPKLFAQLRQEQYRKRK
jgi:Kef-type K+ transport system membrane component KefB